LNVLYCLLSVRVKLLVARVVICIWHKSTAIRRSRWLNSWLPK